MNLRIYLQFFFFRVNTGLLAGGTLEQLQAAEAVVDYAPQRWSVEPYWQRWQF